MRLTSSLALSGLLAASLVPAMAQTVAPAPSNGAPIVTTSPGASSGTSTTGINTNGTGTAAGTANPATTNPATTSATMGGGAGNGPGTSTGTSPGTGTSATGTTGTVVTPSMSGAALSNAGAPTNPGNANPAVDTTGAKPMAQPAKGANSFTEGQAKSRLAGNGFTDISTLTKDADGVWRGRATKGGKTGDVWLDYRGNYGQP